MRVIFAGHLFRVEKLCFCGISHTPGCGYFPGTGEGQVRTYMSPSLEKTTRASTYTGLLTSSIACNFTIVDTPTFRFFFFHESSSRPFDLLSSIILPDTPRLCRGGGTSSSSSFVLLVLVLIYSIFYLWFSIRVGAMGSTFFGGFPSSHLLLVFLILLFLGTCYIFFRKCWDLLWVFCFSFLFCTLFWVSLWPRKFVSLPWRVRKKVLDILLRIEIREQGTLRCYGRKDKPCVEKILWVILGGRLLRFRTKLSIRLH